MSFVLRPESMRRCSAGRRFGVPWTGCDGRPGTRQGGRTPHRGGAVLPVDAYSLAIACGSRGVSLDIWPASVFGTRRVVRCPSSRTRQGSLLVPHDTSRHDLVPATPELLPGRRGVPPAPWRPSWPSVVRLPPRATANVAYGALRCVVDRLRCCVAARHSRSSYRCFHTPGSSSRPRRLWRPMCAAHHTTASSRGHQRSC